MKIKQSKRDHVFTEIELPSDIDGDSIDQIGEEIIDYIIERTKDGKGANGKAFPGYSKSYINSLDFAIAGKSPDEVDLTLSSELLDSLKVVSIEGRKLRIGYDEGDSRNNGVAEGNIIGSYGQPKANAKKARNFLEITSKEIEPIVNRYKEEPTLADTQRLIRERAFDMARSILFDDLEE